MNDRELLELAAKAAGLKYIKPTYSYDGSMDLVVGENPMSTHTWNPHMEPTHGTHLRTMPML